MNLIEQVQKLLGQRMQNNDRAMGKMLELRKEVEALAKLSGYIEVFDDGFNYYNSGAKSLRQRLLFRCFVEDDQVVLTHYHLHKDDERTIITYDPLETILSTMACKISLRLAGEGNYKL